MRKAKIIGIFLWPIFCNKKSNAHKRCYFGDPGEIRTHDPQFRRLLLYPAELPDHLYVCMSSTEHKLL